MFIHPFYPLLAKKKLDHYLDLIEGARFAEAAEFAFFNDVGARKFGACLEKALEAGRAHGTLLPCMYPVYTLRHGIRFEEIF